MIVDQGAGALRDHQELVLLFVPVAQGGHRTGRQIDKIDAELGQPAGIAKRTLRASGHQGGEFQG